MLLLNHSSTKWFNRVFIIIEGHPDWQGWLRSWRQVCSLFFYSVLFVDFFLPLLVCSSHLATGLVFRFPSNVRPFTSQYLGETPPPWERVTRSCAVAVALGKGWDDNTPSGQIRRVTRSPGPGRSRAETKSLVQLHMSQLESPGQRPSSLPSVLPEVGWRGSPGWSTLEQAHPTESALTSFRVYSTRLWPDGARQEGLTGSFSIIASASKHLCLPQSASAKSARAVILRRVNFCTLLLRHISFLTASVRGAESASNIHSIHRFFLRTVFLKLPRTPTPLCHIGWARSRQISQFFVLFDRFLCRPKGHPGGWT